MPKIDDRAIIDEIRDLLMAESLPMPDEIASLAGDYQQLCVEANQRLRECSRLLDRGLRSEAIQLCDQEPNLLDLVATLDFPERRKWIDYLRKTGEKAPPELLIDVASEMNEAYAAEQPLASLMQEYRLEALARVSLGTRINTLRRIARADATNPVWQEDLRKYEQSRLQELQQVLAAALKAEDVETVATLEQEVTAPGWLEKPPPQIVQRINQAHSQLRVKLARDELRRMEPELVEAHSAFDVDRARALAARWQACVFLANLSDADPLVQSVAPTLAWLADQEQQQQSQADFNAAVRRIDQALDAQASREELERLSYDALRYQLPFPALTEQRLRERMESLAVSADRRRKLLIASAVGVVVVLAAATTFGIRAKLARDAIAQEAGILRVKIDGEDYDDADTFLAGLESRNQHAYSSLEIQSLKSELDDKKEAENRRKREFDEGLAQASKLLEPADAPISALRMAQSQASQLTAKLDDEAKQLAKLQKAIVDRIAQVRKVVNDKYRAQLSSLDAEYKQLELQAKTASLDEKSLISLIGRVNDLNSRIVGEKDVSLDADISSLTLALQTKLGKIHDGHKENKEQIRLLADVTNAVGDVDRYKKALEAYHDKSIDTQRGKDFGKALDDVAVWMQAERWNRMLARWKTVNVEQLVAGKEAELLDQARLLAKDPIGGGFPHAVELRSRLKKLDEMGVGDPNAKADSDHLKQLNELLNNPSIASLQMLKVNREGQIKQYYMHAPPTLNASTGKITFKYLGDFELNERAGSATKEEMVRKEAPYHAEAPQSKVARQILDLAVANRDDSKWGDIYCTAIGLVANEPDMEPILKLILIDRLMELGGSLNPTANRIFSKQREIIAAANLVLTVNWLNPDDKQANAERSKVVSLLRRLGNLANLGADLKGDNSGLGKPLGEPYQWIGWLMQESGSPVDRKWSCAMPRPQSITGNLAVIFWDKADNKLRIEQVGRLQGGNAEITIDAKKPFLIEGRPIYALISSKN